MNIVNLLNDPAPPWAIPLFFGVGLLLVIIFLAFFSKTKSPREKREETVELMRDCVRRLETHRAADEFEQRWDYLVNWITSEGLNPETYFGLTKERRNELLRKAQRTQAEDEVRETANRLNASLAAFADATVKARDTDQNPLDLGAASGLLAALAAWENAQQEG